MKNFFSFLGLFMLAVLSYGLSACGSDDDRVNPDDGINTKPISLVAGDKTTIIGASKIISRNEFVTKIVDNEVTGWHVGETTLFVNDKYNISITVKPKYTLYDDPICDWGCSPSTVKSKQKQGILKSSDTKAITYQNAGAATVMMYNFENNKLVSVGVAISTKYLNDYAGFLKERFIWATTYSGEDTFFVGVDNIREEDAKTVVVTTVYNTEALMSIYMPASKYLTRSLNSQENAMKGLVDLLNTIDFE